MNGFDGISINQVSVDYDFFVNGVSYIGNPRNNTVMYVSKKVENLIVCLHNVKECLVFVEDDIYIPEDLYKENCFIHSSNPQKDYAKFVNQFGELKREKNRKRRYNYNREKGIWIGENVTIGDNAYIEPMVFIDHDVVIGDNAVVSTGSIIRNAVIGNNFRCYEKALIGIDSFNLAKDDEGNTFRIPSLGTIRIGDNVDVGANCIIALAATSVTEINDFSKIDANVVIGHDCKIGKNVEIATNANLGGYVKVDDDTFIAMNVTVKNRVSIGKNCFVGIGSVVLRDILNEESVFGVPARKIRMQVEDDKYGKKRS